MKVGEITQAIEIKVEGPVSFLVSTTKNEKLILKTKPG